MKRQTSEQLHALSTHWSTFDEVEIKELIDKLQEWLDEDCSHINLEVDWDESSSVLVTPVKYREETDEEYETRLKGEKYWKDEAERKDREIYERLKAKYENKEN